MNIQILIMSYSTKKMFINILSALWFSLHEVVFLPVSLQLKRHIKDWNFNCVFFRWMLMLFFFCLASVELIHYWNPFFFFPPEGHELKTPRSFWLLFCWSSVFLLFCLFVCFAMLNEDLIMSWGDTNHWFCPYCLSSVPSRRSQVS